jgi:hypothetical protein
MDYHQNARLTVFSREKLARKGLEEGWTLKQAAVCFNVTAKAAGKSVRSFREGGVALGVVIEFRIRLRSAGNIE